MEKKMFLIILALVSLALLVVAASNVSAKSLYVLSSHHDLQFDAWDINPNGTATFQAPITLMYAWAPGDIAIDESSNVMFVTSEGTGSPYPMVELVDAKSMTSLGYVMGPPGAGTDMAGIDTDDENNIVYVMKRGSYTAGELYAFDWDESTTNLTLKSGFPVNVTGGGLGISLDEKTGILWVCDANTPGYARAYNTATWIEDTSLTFSPSHQPVDIAVDRVRGYVYTVSMHGGAWVPSGCGSQLLSKYDLTTNTETTLDVGHELVGVAVDETTGYVYTTSGYLGSSGTESLEVWDTSTSPWTQLQISDLAGSPCGVCIPQSEVSYNPLNLDKDDRLDVCVDPCDMINYSICFDNMNDFIANNVILEDALPSEVTFVGASDGGIYDSVNHKVVWDEGDISIEGGNCEWLLVQVDSLTPPETTITNYVTIDSNETPPTTVLEETLVCNGSGEDYPPTQTIELGIPLMEDIYYTGLEWLDLIGSQTPVWINSSDAETGTDFIQYKLFKSDIFGSWNDPEWVYVYDNQQTGDPFTTDTDLNNGIISIQFCIEESCFHQIHAHCVDTVGNWNYLDPYDFLVDFDAPSNDDFIYIDSYLLPGGARYVSDQTIKRIFANDTGCTGGVAGVDRIIWRIENNKTQIIAEGIIYDNNYTGYEDDNVSVSGDLDDTEGKMIIDIQIKEECAHFIYHQAIDKLENKVSGRKQLVYVDLTPPTVIKTIGEPNCTIVHGEEYCVTTGTAITIDAEDRGCMGGVGLDFLEYHIWNESDGWDNWSYIEDSDGVTIYFGEECTHYLEIHAVDLLGNEIFDNETFYVDETYPEIEKIVGTPNCPVSICVDTYCVTTYTNITINASDPGCCGGLTVEYRIWNNSFDSGWIVIGTLPFNLSFSEECMHNLSIRAYDCLGHMVYDNETFFVDDTPPIIENEIGEPNCEIEEGAEYCITTWTPITINASNAGCCIDDYLYIEYRINEENWTYVEPVTDIFIDQECNHTLTIRAWDCLGNMAEDIEIFHVDDQAPIISKTVGDPNCTDCGEMGEGDYCVTTDTFITLEAEDQGCCVENVTIEYNIWFDDEWTGWTEYVEPFNFTDECEHLLVVRAMDCLGNTAWDNETFYVDDSPPEIIKNVGDPKCTDCGEMGEGDYCVTTDTLITLDAVEVGCCPCPDVTLEYRIWYMDEWTNWTEYVEPFNFTDECEHLLVVRAMDCLGNTAWDNETFYVDDSPPEIIKNVGDPKCTDCGEMGEGDYCVTTDTLITLDAVDVGCCPCENLTIEYMIGFYEEEVWVWTDWFEYIEPFNFTEECEHMLMIKAYDCLGNGLDDAFLDNETFYVDDTPPPKPEKIVGDPKVKLENDSSGHDQWMIFPETEICFTEIGDEGCCPCEEVTIEYRIWYLGSWTEWTDYTECITLTRGCVHYLEARAYDCLGNRGEIDNETFWVCAPGDTGPTIQINDPMFGSTHCERTLKVNVTAFDYESSWDELTVKLWIPGGRRDAPTLWYDPVYNITDGYWYADIDIFKYQDGAEITLQAVAVDGDLNSEFAIPVTFEICSSTVWDQWMQNGWNSLILPLDGIGCSPATEDVLASIDGMYDWMFWYNPLTKLWDFYSYDDKTGFLTEMKAGELYWIHMNETEARFYTDTSGPEVEILDPIDGDVRCEGPGSMNFYAYDYETGVEEVNVLIHDITSDEYWNSTAWITEETWLLCAHDYNEYWDYDSEGIWTLDHSYNITAIATDMAGCTAADEVSISIQCLECTAGGGATVSPESFEATMMPGESAWDNKTVITDDIPIGKLDVMFLFDLTGSMGSVMSSAKSSAIDIMNDIRSSINNSNFGVGSFMDYPSYYSHCGYSYTYGSSSYGDYPWNLDEDITTDTSAVSTAINSLVLGGGSDGPESYARALYESQFAGWRFGARKIVVIFEDNIPHDCDFSTFGCSGNTGVDPGRDAIAGTSDDLPWVDVISDLKASDISVVVVDSGGYNDCPWLYAVSETGGLFEELSSSGDLGDAIVGLIENITATISELTLEVSEGYEDWFEWEPEAYYNVSGGATVEFNVSITVPEETSESDHYICLKVIGDGAILAVQEVSIDVEEAQELYNISGYIYFNGTPATDDMLVIAAEVEWPPSEPGTTPYYMGFIDPIPPFPVAYNLEVPNGTYYVVSGILPADYDPADPVHNALGAAFNMTLSDMETYGPDLITLDGSDVPGQDITLHVIEEPT